jgi:hypothetical protein
MLLTCTIICILSLFLGVAAFLSLLMNMSSAMKAQVPMEEMFRRHLRGMGIMACAGVLFLLGLALMGVTVAQGFFS